MPARPRLLLFLFAPLLALALPVAAAPDFAPHTYSATIGASRVEVRPGLAVAAFTRTGTAAITWALVPAGSPLLSRAVDASEELQLQPVAGVTARAELDRALLQGEAFVRSSTVVRARDLVTPIDGRPIFAPLHLPQLGAVRGDMSSPPERDRRFARVFDLATRKDERDLSPPVRADDARVVRAGALEVLAVPLSSRALDDGSGGVVGVVFGPVARVATATSAAPAATVDEPASAFVGRAARVRVALDERAGALRAGAHLRAAMQGLGTIDRVIEPATPSDLVPHDALLRFVVAHGAAIGLPLVSLGISYLDPSPACVVLCSRGGQLLGLDRAEIDRVRETPLVDLDARARAADVLQAATIGAAVATALLPSGRRGVLSRPEIFEDALVIGEAALVGASTPEWLRTRFGRARPIALRDPNARDVAGRDQVTAPLYAGRTAVAASATGAAVSLLFLEDVEPEVLVPSTLLLGGLTGATAWLEVSSGRVFAADVPVAIGVGFATGAVVALWHQIFWRGWPGDGTRGALPLRVVGLDVSPSRDGAAILLRGEFGP